MPDFAREAEAIMGLPLAAERTATRVWCQRPSLHPVRAWRPLHVEAAPVGARRSGVSLGLGAGRLLRRRPRAGLRLGEGAVAGDDAVREWAGSRP